MQWRVSSQRSRMSGWFDGILNWLKSLFFKQEMELTLVGLQNSGKTTLVNVIAVCFPSVSCLNSTALIVCINGAQTGGFSEDMIPTVGFNMRKALRVWLRSGPFGESLCPLPGDQGKGDDQAVGSWYRRRHRARSAHIGATAPHHTVPHPLEPQHNTGAARSRHLPTPRHHVTHLTTTPHHATPRYITPHHATLFHATPQRSAEHTIKQSWTLVLTDAFLTGGQPRFRSMWERYCRGVNAIVYALPSAAHRPPTIPLLTKPCRSSRHTFAPRLEQIHCGFGRPREHRRIKD